jgi:DNA-binding IclR family transcriptional regulator
MPLSPRPKAARRAPAASRSDAQDEGPGRGTQSLHRAMQLLTAVGERNLGGARLTELAQATGLHIATAHRLLAALVREGMVSQDRDYTKRYFLGARLHTLIDLAPYAEVRPRLRAIAEAAVARTGLVAYIYVPLMNDMMAIERAEPPRAPRILIRDIGRRLPMGVGAGSIAFLAGLPEARARDLVDRNRERFGEFGTLAADQVWASVEEARTLGFGTTREQVARGVVGVGLAITGQDGIPRAALTVVGTPDDLTDARLPSLRPALHDLVVLDSHRPLSPAAEGHETRISARRPI